MYQQHIHTCILIPIFVSASSDIYIYIYIYIKADRDVYNFNDFYRSMSGLSVMMIKTFRWSEAWRVMKGDNISYVFISCFLLFVPILCFTLVKAVIFSAYFTMRKRKAENKRQRLLNLEQQKASKHRGRRCSLDQHTRHERMVHADHDDDDDEGGEAYVKFVACA